MCACFHLQETQYTALQNYTVMSKTVARKNVWGGDLPIVSVYIATFYSFARLLLSALYCHGYSKFLGGGGGGN